jgi:hypothetical protein
MATRTDLPSSHYATQAGLAATFARCSGPSGQVSTGFRLYALLTRFSQASASLSAQDYADAGARLGSARDSPSRTPRPVARTLRQDSQLGLRRRLGRPQPEQERWWRIHPAGPPDGAPDDRGSGQGRPQARAWARETRGDCCYFCALMAARGAVYKSEGAAGGDANARFTGEGAFKFHNNCHCVAVPVFGVYEKPADARGWNRQYHDLKRELGRARRSSNGETSSTAPPRTSRRSAGT